MVGLVLGSVGGGGGGAAVTVFADGSDRGCAFLGLTKGCTHLVSMLAMQLV